MLIDNSAKTNWKFIGIVVILAVVIGVGVMLYGLPKPEGEIPQITPNPSDRVVVSLEDQTCIVDSDCTIVGTLCSTCECGVPVNKVHEQKYIDQYRNLCQDYRRPVCDFICGTPFTRCIDNQCVLSTEPPDPSITPLPTSTSPPSDFYEVTFQDFDLRCLGMGVTQEFIARNQADYQHLIDISPDLQPNPSLLCIEYEFPTIDFTQMTLLGKAIGGGGCSSEVEKSVFRNDDERTVLYSITSTFMGLCEKFIHSNNFVLVSKIPDDYIVKFEIDIQSDL